MTEDLTGKLTITLLDSEGTIPVKSARDVKQIGSNFYLVEGVGNVEYSTKALAEFIESMSRLHNPKRIEVVY